MTEPSTADVLTPEQQARAARFVQLLIATRTLIGRPRPASRRALSLQLEVSPTMMNRYESGNVDPAEVRFGVLSKLAQVLGVSLSSVGMYLLHGKTRGLLEHPSMEEVAHLLAVESRPADPLPTIQPPAWSVRLQTLTEAERARVALRLMQTIAGRLLELGGAIAGRQMLLEQMSEGLIPRARKQQQKQFDAQIQGLIQGQLPLESDFWRALARPSVGLVNPEMPPEQAVESLLQDLGLAATPEA